jgi:uncharacterized protein YqcC (DUF446 family)
LFLHRRKRLEMGLNSTRKDPDRRAVCGKLLVDTETTMRELGLWDETAPPPEAFRSVLPFSVDTLDLCQWLQWVFIPRTRELLDRGDPLPTQSAIYPLAIEVFRDLPQDTGPLLALIARFDRLITTGSAD